MIDLHTHSTESDGTYSPVDLVRLAAAEGITLLALTDHDTIHGLEAAAAEAARLGIRFVPGIEIAINHPSKEFHLLGLGLCKALVQFSRDLAALKQRRNLRNAEILRKINAAGIALTQAELLEMVEGDTIGRPHFARALVKKGLAANIPEAFKLFLGVDKPFYVPIETLTLAAGIALIKSAGGIAVIAHPISLKLPIRKLKEFLLKCKKEGLDGIEVYHPYHSEKFSKDLARFAGYNEFIVTGGSDFHGKRREERKLGFMAPGVPIPEGAGEGVAGKRE